ncbi:MAG: M20/M25/M40 family metallo-hydrolase [Firmicutes bacterium]|nr:M20/M25/M40 family metallo-hydrolase [Bacillota bacterium]MCL5038226.1 M20/M25/M40 family metallo-hydrolase [Bacillota bacterium]
MPLPKALEYISSQREDYLTILFRLVRQPSISSQRIGVEECALLLRDIMEEQGIRTEIIPTAGLPIVYGEVRTDPALPTILFYGHYDVQPPEPLELWDSPPFEPTIRGGRIFGRGVADNKGQLLAHVLAAGAFLKTSGQLPVNAKFLFEGEEESSSLHLAAFVQENRERLAADVVYTSDGPMHDSGRPLVFFGARGLLYVELTATGAKHDLHSGNKGGIAPNPAWELVNLLSTMRDRDGNVTIDGFYDDVRPPTNYERQLLAALPLDEEEIKRDLGISQLPGPGDISFYERLMFRPTLNIAGFASGYGGAGSKTIIPARGVVKMDMRLVADQDPDDIYEKFVRHVKRQAPGIEVRRLGRTPPSKTSPELPVSRLVVAAVGEARGETPVVAPTLGGTLPDYVFTKILGLPSVGVPYANPDERNHAPNENLVLENFYAGIRTSAFALERMQALALRS